MANIFDTTRREEVGDFYVHLVQGNQVERSLSSSTKLLRQSNKVSVIHFYDSG
jgi:hypothetical protein